MAEDIRRELTLAYRRHYMVRAPMCEVYNFACKVDHTKACYVDPGRLPWNKTRERWFIPISAAMYLFRLPGWRVACPIRRNKARAWSNSSIDLGKHRSVVKLTRPALSDFFCVLCKRRSAMSKIEEFRNCSSRNRKLSENSLTEKPPNVP